MMILMGAGGAQPRHLLFPVGGDYTPTTLQAFARAAAERTASGTVDLLVLPAAYGDTPSIGQNTALAGRRTDQVREACQAVLPDYPRLTGCTATLLPVFMRADAEDPANAAALDDATVDGVFILGGDQDVAMQIVAGTPLEAAMARAYDRGVVFGGTSAGDAVESRDMIWGFTDAGTQANELQRGSVLVWWGDDPDLERGLSFGSTATILDQHFYQQGRFGRLLNVIGQSASRYGNGGKLGAGVDLATAVRLRDDATLSGVVGDSSVAVIDGRSAGGTHRWVGASATLSARNWLTDLIPPGPFGYDVANRVPLQNGSPVSFTSPGPLPAGLLDAPGAGALILGGDVSGDPTGPALSEFVDRARAAGGGRIVEVFAGYPATGASNHDAQLYGKAVVDAGWTGRVDQIVYGQHALDAADLSGAAGVLFVGGDQHALAAPLRDATFRSFVQAALAAAPVVMTDHAMTAAAGSWYAASPEPQPKTLEQDGIDAFRTSGVPVRRGLGLIDGAAFEPRLTADYRWGRLYALAHAHPGTIDVGICQDTGIVIDGTRATVVGDISAVSLDARAASFANGTNGALAAFNVLLNAYAPGDAVG
jgi:cyanophycinase